MFVWLPPLISRPTGRQAAPRFFLLSPSVRPRPLAAVITFHSLAPACDSEGREERGVRFLMGLNFYLFHFQSGRRAKPQPEPSPRGPRAAAHHQVKVRQKVDS